ncbi:MAG TPA: DUF1176 domain-containing protein [Chroococcidiopsis sp.]
MVSGWRQTVMVLGCLVVGTTVGITGGDRVIAQPSRVALSLISLEVSLDAQRQAVYRAALESVSPGESVDAAVLASLRSHPEQTFAMFDGCLQYWVQLNATTADPSPEITEFDQQQHYANFPAMADGISIYRLTPTQSLVSIPCWLGPYWVATVNYLYTEPASEPANEPTITAVTLPTYDRTQRQVVAGTSSMTIGWQNFDADSQVLSLSHRYSGAGHCGFQATYQFETQSETRPETGHFILTEFREQPDCETFSQPNAYPRLYP